MEDSGQQAKDRGKGAARTEDRGTEEPGARGVPRRRQERGWDRGRWRDEETEEDGETKRQREGGRDEERGTERRRGGGSEG
eukprot:236534-Rhodomonas_salina.1